MTDYTSFEQAAGAPNWDVKLNALCAALNTDIAALYTFVNSAAGTSETSLSVATGSKAFTIDQAAFAASGGTWKATSTGAPTAVMVGTFVSFTGGVLTLTVTNVGGSGTHADWQITPVLASASASAEVDVASATTTDLGAAASDNVRITGTTTITGLGTALAGIRRYVRFQGALSLTHNATSLILKGAATRTTAANDSSLFESLGSGNWIELLADKADGTSIIPAIAFNYIGGFGLSNDSGTPNSKIDIAAGYASDSTNAVMITGTAIVKSTGGVWAAGTGSNGMGTGLTIAISTWYHVFAAIISGAFDAFIDTSVTAANKPGGTTAFRRIGSFLTDGSANIRAFVQYGQTFYWPAGIADASNVTPSATPTLIALSVPTGLSVEPIFSAKLNEDAATAHNLRVWSPLQSSTLANANGSVQLASFSAVSADFPAFASRGLLTNTSAQLYYAINSAANTPKLNINTIGWVDPHIAAIW